MTGKKGEEEEEPNPVKDILYETIGELGEDWIKENISKGDVAKAVGRIISESLRKAGRLEGDHGTNVAKLLTSLLHYLLSLVLIPSQRKITVKGIDVDIVIPNQKTLEAMPEESILICIPEIRKTDIGRQIRHMEEIQPVKENIWYVTENELDKKTYSIKNGTILGITEDIDRFLASKKTVQFRFFKA